MTKIALTAVAGARSAAALLLAPAAAAPVRPVQRRADGQPTQGRRLHRHRQQSRRRPGRPVHRGRGPCRPDVQPDRFRNTRSPGRHPPSPARPYSSTSPAEQPRPPGGHLSSVLPGGYRVVVPSGRLRPPQGVLGHNSGAAPIIPVIADAVERPPTEHVTPIRQARPTS